jgi:hypothetical protein
MEFDILGAYDLVYGAFDKDVADHLIKDSNVGMGIYLDFYSDSPSLCVKYKLNYKPVKKFQCPILTNGFSYSVKDQSGKIIRQSNCYSWKGGAEETIIKRKTSSLLHYLFFLPTFNSIISFVIRVEDGYRLYSKRPHSSPIVTVGSSLVSGEGCTFPNSTFNNILVQKIDKNIIGLQTSNFSLEYIQQIMNMLKPSHVVFDLAFVSEEELEKNTSLVRALSDKYRTIVIRRKRKLFGRNKIGTERIVYCSSYLDEYSFVLPDLLNDRGHYILSELIIKELCSHGIE